MNTLIPATMSRLKLFLILLVMAGTCALMAGCTSQPAAQPTPTATPTPAGTTTPTVTITSPANGADIGGGDIPVTIRVQGLSIVDKQGQANVPGEGHVHYYLDMAQIPSDPTKPAVPSGANAVWAHVAATSYTFTNVPPGMHTVTVQLVNNDHTPLVPLVSASVMVTVTGQSTTTPQPTATTGPSGGQTVSASLAAKNIAFDKSSITVPAGATVDLTFDNQDAGIPHNFAVYTDSTAKTKIFAGEIVTGPKTVTYTFTAPSQPGTYFFRCDVHPTTMTGSFIVT